MAWGPKPKRTPCLDYRLIGRVRGVPAVLPYYLTMCANAAAAVQLRRSVVDSGGRDGYLTCRHCAGFRNF